MRYIIFSSFLGLVAALVGATIAIQQHPERFSNLFEKKNEVLKRIPYFTMIDIEGAERTSSEWNDHVVVLNFWAPWCPPCEKETPGFVELQEKYFDRGVRFIGVAIDDPDTVQDFMDTYGVEYTVLLGDMKAINFSRELAHLTPEGLAVNDFAIAPSGDLAAVIVVAPGERGAESRLYLVPLGGDAPAV